MNTSIPFVDLKAQHTPLRAEIDAAIAKVIDTCSFILGPQVAAFEKSFAAFVGADTAIGVSDGLDALTLALRAADVGPGDEVILPANTFIATALAATQAGARVVPVDCNPRTWEIDVAAVAAAITPRTKAIMPVHLYGMAADMDPILSIARTHGLAVVEDAAQAHGTQYKGRPCGSFGTAAGFSFYPGKNLGACGDGGMVVTSDPRIADRVRSMRNYGQRAKYEHVEKGGNSRLDTIQAVILDIKLRHLPAWNAARAAHAAHYRELLAGVGDLRFQEQDPNSSHIYHLMVVETSHREALQKHLKADGVDTGIHYPNPVHLQQAYLDLGYRKGSFPVSERLAGRIFSLPMFAELTEQQIEHACNSVKSYFAAVGSARAA
jgi:dTDP-4-amino-4,6-dideoxygalactose transaminase